MLQVATEFPLAGSYTLFVDGRRTMLVRIQQRWLEAGEWKALISFVGTARAGGNRTVGLAELVDVRPLTAAEKAEELALFRKLLARRNAGQRIARKDRDRHATLRLREIDAERLDRMLRDAGLDWSVAA